LLIDLINIVEVIIIISIISKSPTVIPLSFRFMIKNIFCLSVNDPYVMHGWGEINNIGDKIKMLSDPYLLFTKAIGAEVDRNAKGMGIRSNRYLMVIENFTIVNIHVEKETKECGLTSAENLLNNLI